MTEMTWPFEVSVFETSLRFHLFILHFLAGVFEFIHFGHRFRKATFSMITATILITVITDDFRI